MHVGLLTTSFPLPGNPVSGIFVARLAEQLSRDMALTVLTPCGTDGVRPGPGGAYRVRCFRYAPRALQRIAHQPGGIPAALRQRRWLWLLVPFFLTGMFIACWRLARRVDLIHANWTASGVIAGLAGRLSATPVVTTLRGSDVARLERSVVERALLGLCLRTNARLVCVSQAMADQVALGFPAARPKLSVVPNGVSPSLLDIRREPGRAQTGPLTLLMVGSLTRNKAHRVALEALRQLDDAGRSELVIVGDGPERSALKGLADAYGLTARIRFEGQLAPDEIPGVLAAADVLLLTSHSEGRPNVVLEAMAAGLPVIASRIPGVTEIVQHELTGSLFDPDDAPALAECIVRLQRDPALRARLGENGRRFIREHGLLWDQTAKAYAGVYRAACGGTVS